MDPRKRLIVALDVPGRDDALRLAAALKDTVGMVKIGLEGFVAHGPSLVQAARDLGLEVFLDLKLHDIPRTVAAAVTQASALGARLLTVHAAGGREMIRAARDAAPASLSIIAVTMLTSLDDAASREIGFAHGVAESAGQLGKLALASGADGLVCSAHELQGLAALGGSRVVPGIRPAGHGTDDQKRSATAEQAVRVGATWIVVGRPIVQARDPVAAAKAIVAEIERAEADA